MSKEMEQDKDFMRELKIKGMVDGAGHYVELKEVDKEGKIWWHWNDGALTHEGFKRDRVFNFLFSMIKIYRHNKILVKFFLIGVLVGIIYCLIF